MMLRRCVSMDNNSKVFVAGHNGLVGSSIIRNLKSKHYENIYWVRRKNCDLTNKVQVDAYFEQSKPEYVFLAAAKVGGNGVKKLLFLGSSCIYPKMAKQPITEDALMTGPLEPTNDAYATAKIAGIKMCQAYRQQYGFNAISLMPTNLYGPNDNFDINTGHVLPSLMAKFHGSLEKSKYWVVKLWGDGSPMREFLHVDDLAEACIKCMQDYNEPEPINVGTLSLEIHHPITYPC